MLEFIHKKSGRKILLEEGDTIRINAVGRAGYVSSGEYVAPVVKEVVPEPTVGEIVDSIAEANPEPEEIPMVAVEAVHEGVDPADFVDLLDPPSDEEESSGEAQGGEAKEGPEEASNGGSDDNGSDEAGYSETGSEEEEGSISESISEERTSDDDVLGVASTDGVGSSVEGSSLSDIPIG